MLVRVRFANQTRSDCWLRYENTVAQSKMEILGSGSSFTAAVLSMTLFATVPLYTRVEG